MEQQPSQPNPAEQQPAQPEAQVVAAANRALTHEEVLLQGREMLANSLAEVAKAGGKDAKDAVEQYMHDVLADTSDTVPAPERLALADVLFQEQRNKNGAEFLEDLGGFTKAFKGSNERAYSNITEVMLPVSKRTKGLHEANAELNSTFDTPDTMKDMFPVHAFTPKQLKIMGVPRKQREHYEPKDIEGRGDNLGYVIANDIRNIALLGIEESGLDSRLKQWRDQQGELLGKASNRYSVLQNDNGRLDQALRRTSPEYNYGRENIDGMVANKIVASLADTFADVLNKAAKKPDVSPFDVINPFCEAAKNRDLDGKITDAMAKTSRYAQETSLTATNISNEVAAITSGLYRLLEGYDSLRDIARDHRELVDGDDSPRSLAQNHANLQEFLVSKSRDISDQIYLTDNIINRITQKFSEIEHKRETNLQPIPARQKTDAQSGRRPQQRSGRS